MSRGGVIVTAPGTTLVQEIGPLGAPAASLDFNPIPQTGRSLLFVGNLRTDTAATFDSVQVAFNADAVDANYDHEQLFASAAAAGAVETRAAAGSRSLIAALGATAPAATFGQVEITIADYTSAARLHTAFGKVTSWRGRGAGAVVVTNDMVGYAVAAAIARVTFTPLSGGNFVAGSRMALYLLA